MRRADITGTSFGDLIALEVGPTRKKETMWICKCSCGRIKEFYTKALVRGFSTSCGHPKERHGESYSVEYRLYRGILTRCTNPKNQDWHIYGGKGITCDFLSFSEFLKELGRRPEGGGYSVDRIDGNKNYAPGNVRWATLKEQANNKCTNRLITAFGKTMNLGQWAIETGFSREAIEKRIDTLKWSIERALTHPIKGRISALESTL